MGPWKFTFEKPDGFPVAFIDASKTKDVTNADLNIIDIMGTCADELMAVVMAADGSMLPEHHHTSGWIDDCRLCASVNALKAKLAGVK